jgi:A/G-specific adenine glycosylase
MSKTQRTLPTFSNSRTSTFRRTLLAWYDAQKRDLPWRASRDPYRVWLSEIMLQQTRVAAVLEHYREFLRRFPNIEKLAAARESSVLAAWSGLGYYRRARMLHAAAKLLVRQHAGKFPSTAKELLSLPGIGRYTAAAVASIAFGEPLAVVDGNVDRVLERLSGKQLPEQQLWKAANLLLDRNRPGDFNQAMMELGAMVCTPRSPLCLTCPVAERCATRGELTVTPKPPRQKKREIHCALVLHNGDFRTPEFGDGECPKSNKDGRQSEVLLVLRSRTASLMPGMWELPALATSNRNANPLFTLRHSITVTDYTVRVWRTAAPAETRGRWIPTERLSRLPLTGLARKILRKAQLL